jgi:hypothetical protein
MDNPLVVNSAETAGGIDSDMSELLQTGFMAFLLPSTFKHNLLRCGWWYVFSLVLKGTPTTANVAATTNICPFGFGKSLWALQRFWWTVYPVS